MTEQSKKAAHIQATTRLLALSASDMAAEIERLRAERDQLLAALKDTLGALDAEYGTRVVDINFKLLRAAIAAVEEKP